MKFRCFRETQIGTDDVAGFDNYDVARHKLFRLDFHDPAIASYPGFDDAEATERLHGLKGPQLGKEADGGVDQDDDQDGSAFGPLSEHKGQAGGGPEKNDDEAFELIVEDDRQALGRAFYQAIEPELALPLADVDSAQAPVRLNPKPFQRIVDADGINIPEGKRSLLISNRSHPRSARKS